MSLVKSPLYLILPPNVEIGLSGDNGRGILFVTECSFVLNVHVERGAGVKEAVRGRTGELESSLDFVSL
jgi:hypothetical protein